MTKMTHEPLTLEQIREVSALARRLHAARCRCTKNRSQCLTYSLARMESSITLYPLSARKRLT